MEPIALTGFAAIALVAAGARDRVVVPAAAGFMSGYGIVTIAVVAGIGTLAVGAPEAMTVLTVAGSGYLAYLGWRTLRRPGPDSGSSRSGASDGTTNGRHSSTP